MIKNPNDSHYGIFSDRKSAIKFKNWLITNHLDDIKDAIMNVLRTVGGKSENIEKAIDAFTKMKIQGLYDDDLPTRGGSGDWIRSRWYEKDIS
jgi:arginine repressor